MRRRIIGRRGVRRTVRIEERRRGSAAVGLEALGVPESYFILLSATYRSTTTAAPLYFGHISTAR